MNFLPNNYTPSAQLLKNKVILITGAGDGIGKEAAWQYAKHGATVILLGRTESKLDTLYDEIVSAGYPKPAIVPVDLSTAASSDFSQLHNMLEAEFGQLDGLLHNASLLGLITPLEHYDPALFDEVMRVNVNAAFYLTRALMPLLKQSNSASILFTTSSVGRKGRAFWGAYSISKFATEGMMQVFNDELENISNIRVNCINPGATRTNMRAQAYPAEDTSNLQTPNTLMPAYLYLMSDDSVKINGESLDLQAK